VVQPLRDLGQLRATEQERLRLAADLHDGPVQELTALRSSLSRARTRVRRGQHEGAQALLAGLEVDLGTGVSGVRRLMSELRPAVLDDQGLEAALRSQARAFEETSELVSDGHFGLAGMRERSSRRQAASTVSRISSAVQPLGRKA
jgi:signal transduction histidine kinase